MNDKESTQREKRKAGERFQSDIESLELPELIYTSSINRVEAASSTFLLPSSEIIQHQKEHLESSRSVNQLQVLIILRSRFIIKLPPDS